MEKENRSMVTSIRIKPSVYKMAMKDKYEKESLSDYIETLIEKAHGKKGSYKP